MIVNIMPHKEGVLIKPGAYLGDKFNDFREALREGGATYEHSTRSNHAALAQVPVLIEKLAVAGFEAHLDTEIAERLRAEAKAAQEALEGAKDRIKAVNAMLDERGLKLFPFQVGGVQWLASRKSGILADEMGLGKSIQTAVAIPPNAPVVAVCPASLKRSVWEREISKWRPDLRTAVLSGRGSFYWPSAGDMVIVNYDILPTGEVKKKGDLFATESVTPEKGTILLADEAHALKNKKANRTKAFKAMRDKVLAVDGRVWLLTGTPLLNNPMELWNLLDICGCATEVFGHFGKFAKMFGGGRGLYGMEWGGQVSKEVPQALRKAILHRRREEVLPDLPTKIWKDILVELDPETAKIADAAIEAAKLKGIDFNEVADEVALTKLVGAAFEQMSAARSALAKSKIPAMLEQVEVYEDGGEPVVVFSYHRDPIDILAKRPGWAVITGDTKDDERARIVNDFQGGRLKGLGATIQAGGTGLTLTKANQMIFVDLAWTPALNKQAEDRCCRIGQTRGVIVNRLIADHAIDQRVAELLLTKQRLIESSVEAAAVVVPKLPEQSDLSALDKVKLRKFGEQPAPQPHQSAQPVGSTMVCGNPPFEKPRGRGPLDLMESWAMKHLPMVAEMDRDHARSQNGVGFSKMDSDFGHSMAEVAKRGIATDKQWFWIVKLARKYQKQAATEPPKQEA